MVPNLIFAIAFCTVQYGRERKLEEEYAFKSNISISLIPYQELVGKLTDVGESSEKAKYTAFIIDSVNKVFTSPTERVFHPESHHKPLPDKVVRQVFELTKELIKAGKAQP